MLIYLYKHFTYLPLLMDQVPHAFFCAVRHERTDEILEILKQYDIGSYIIGKEKAEDTHQETDGEHLHFYVEMIPRDYNAFAKRCFIKHLGLRGRAGGGKPRQYGKVSFIENVELMQAYTLKDGDYVTNMTDAEIQRLAEQSFKKNDREKMRKKVMNACSEAMAHAWKTNSNEPTYRVLRDAVVLAHIREQIKADVSRNIIERYIRMYVLYYSEMSEQEKMDFLTTYFLSYS